MEHQQFTRKADTNLFGYVDYKSTSVIDFLQPTCG